MSIYLIINIAIIIFPLILTFEKKIRYYKKLPSVFVSMAFVGLPFLTWDAAAAARGDWFFNPAYISSLKAAGLPIEEILFFVTVPYSMLFLYETLKIYVKEKEYNLNSIYMYTAAAAILIFSLFVTDYYYTFTVLGLTLVLMLFSLTKLGVFKFKTYWLWIGFSYIPFTLVNYVLTSLPVVKYSDKAILGLRITTIPVEDILYSFTLLTFYLMIYTSVEKRWIIKKM